MEAPVINVGIMTHKAISFVFNEEYVHTETGTFTIGEQRALWVNGKIVYNGKLYQELFFEPTSPQSSFEEVYKRQIISCLPMGRAIGKIP